MTRRQDPGDRVDALQDPDKELPLPRRPPDIGSSDRLRFIGQEAIGSEAGLDFSQSLHRPNQEERADREHEWPGSISPTTRSPRARTVPCPAGSGGGSPLEHATHLGTAKPQTRGARPGRERDRAPKASSVKPSTVGSSATRIPVRNHSRVEAEQCVTQPNAEDQSQRTRQ